MYNGDIDVFDTYLMLVPMKYDLPAVEILVMQLSSPPASITAYRQPSAITPVTQVVNELHALHSGNDVNHSIIEVLQGTYKFFLERWELLITASCDKASA